MSVEQSRRWQDRRWPGWDLRAERRIPGRPGLGNGRRSLYQNHSVAGHVLRAIVWLPVQLVSPDLKG